MSKLSQNVWPFPGVASRGTGWDRSHWCQLVRKMISFVTWMILEGFGQDEGEHFVGSEGGSLSVCTCILVPAQLQERQ